MTDLTLINPSLSIYNTEIFVPHLGILQLAAYAKQNGFSVKIIDSSDIKIEEINSKFIGISVISSQFFVVKELIDKIRKKLPQSKIVLGGPHVSNLPFDSFNFLKSDFIIVGPGEKQLIDILSNKKINKISYGTNLNINKLPLPARHLVNLNSYSAKINDIQATNIITSKGCPFNCYFCAKTKNIKYQFKKEELVSQEIKEISQKYNIKAIIVHDDIFTLYHERLKKIAKTFYEEGIIWRCLSRVDHISYDLFKYMKDNGCVEVVFGIESGSDKILNIINKKTTREQNINAIKLAKKAGLKVNVNLIVGIPGETKEDIELTKSLIGETKPDDWRLGTFVPFPGSFFWDNSKKYSIEIDNNFSKYYINNKDGKGGYIYKKETIEFREDLLSFLRKNVKDQF